MAAIKLILFKRDNSKNFYVKWIDPVTLRERRKSTKTKIRREAERFSLRLEKELNEGVYYDRSMITWKQFRERYETEVVPGMAKRTSEKISATLNAVERIVSPRLLLQIDANAVSKIVKRHRKNGLQEITIRSNLAHLKSALNWARSIRLINVVPDFPKLKRARTDKAMRGRPLCLEEFDRMIEAIPKVIKMKADTESEKARKDLVVRSWEFYLKGLWCSGLRLAESLELYWDREDKLSIDLTGKYPMLRIRAEAEKGNKDRLLPIVPEFAEFLQNVPEDERIGPVFNPLAEREHIKKLTSLTVSKKIADIGEKANIIVGDKGNRDKATGERKPRFASAHDLRRSFGERWSLKVMPQALMQLMRHESMETTLKFYVGRNAEKVAESIWNSDAGLGTNSGTSSKNGVMQEKGNYSQAFPNKEVRE